VLKSLQARYREPSCPNSSTFLALKRDLLAPKAARNSGLGRSRRWAADGLGALPGHARSGPARKVLYLGQRARPLRVPLLAQDKTGPSYCALFSAYALRIGERSKAERTTQETTGWETQAHESFADMLKMLEGGFDSSD
jgi:hypothetical protein